MILPILLVLSLYKVICQEVAPYWVNLTILCGLVRCRHVLYNIQFYHLPILLPNSFRLPISTPSYPHTFLLPETWYKNLYIINNVCL